MPFTGTSVVQHKGTRQPCQSLLQTGCCWPQLVGCGELPDACHASAPAMVTQLHSAHALVEPQLCIIILQLQSLIIHVYGSPVLAQQAQATPNLQQVRHTASWWVCYCVLRQAAAAAAVAASPVSGWQFCVG